MKKLLAILLSVMLLVGAMPLTAFAAMGGLIAPGTDAGAWAVPHGSLTEFDLLADIDLTPGTQAIQIRF